MHGSERRRLTSWKEIAAYLGRDIRTAVRWEKERGLPVRRIPGGKARSVFAYADELDRWIGDGALATDGRTDPTPVGHVARWRWAYLVPAVAAIAIVSRAVVS